MSEAHALVPVLTPFPIRSEDDYKRALRLIDDLWCAAPETSAADVLDIMADLVELYEARTSPVRSPAEPRDILKYKIREKGMTVAALAAESGCPHLADVLENRKLLDYMSAQKLGRALGLRPGLLVHDIRNETVWPHGGMPERAASVPTAAPTSEPVVNERPMLTVRDVEVYEAQRDGAVEVVGRVHGTYDLSDLPEPIRHRWRPHGARVLLSAGVAHLYWPDRYPAEPPLVAPDNVWSTPFGLLMALMVFATLVAVATVAFYGMTAP